MSIESMFAAAHAAQMRGDFAAAARGYRGLVRSKPFAANHNLGTVLGASGDLEGAEAAYRAALVADPKAATSRHALSMLLLAQGRYAEAWPEWEARRGVADLQIPAPDLRTPEWRGEDLAGKRLLVFGEQGLGDKIMLARYFAPLKAAGAEVVFACPPILHRLMRRLGVEPAGPEATEASVAADLWTLQGTLPVRFATTLETLPPPADFGLPLGSGGGVGVVPRGSTVHKNDAERSLGPRHAKRLLALGRDLRPEASGAEDFEATAEIVAGLDLVISVDTSVVHLAASMGKPTWVLLPARDTDWRWLRGREDSPWYPSARLFRQRAAGDWDPVLRRIEAALANHPPDR
ncbi:MAG: hypothetical protein E7812_07590 [Phenylobacterium sp.]|nr:MAG: hypothetical protein E7812_07590 [Phenylobacterium sp.]